MEIQLDLNLECKSAEQLRFDIMQAQIDAMHESMGKVRRKLFAEMTAVKRICEELQRENATLKASVNDQAISKVEWIYGRPGSLFEIQEAVG